MHCDIVEPTREIAVDNTLITRCGRCHLLAECRDDCQELGQMKFTIADTLVNDRDHAWTDTPVASGFFGRKK